MGDNLLEWMSIASLLYGLQNVLVDTERDGAGQREQRQVCGYTDQGEVRQRQEYDQGTTEHGTRLTWVTPID